VILVVSTRAADHKRSQDAEHVTVWSLDFLNDHKQFVKIGESVSSTTIIRAGTTYYPVKVSHSQIVLRPTYAYQLPLSKATRERWT